MCKGFIDETNIKNKNTQGTQHNYNKAQEKHKGYAGANKLNNVTRKRDRPRETNKKIKTNELQQSIQDRK